MSVIVKSRCPSCDKKKMITDDNSGEVFCSGCGFVVLDKIEDTGAEWRSFSMVDASKARAGTATSRGAHDIGMSTIIGPADQDSSGRPLSTGLKNSVHRWRTWDHRTQAGSAAERNLRQAMIEMDKLKDKLALNDTVIENAVHIYKKAADKKLIRGRSIQGMVAACLYAACKDMEAPRTLTDVATGINIRKKDVARCYRLIFRELELSMQIVDPTKDIARIASSAMISEKTKREAAAILVRAKQADMIAGKDPMSMAAAALYIASGNMGEARSQKDIAMASGITEVTIRNRCVGLKKILDN